MLKETQKSVFGKILLLTVTVIWGSSFIVLKDTLDKTGGGHFTFFILAMRFTIAALLIFAIGFKRMKNITKATAVKGVILGVVLALAYGVQTVGLKYTSASKNAFLTATYCVIAPFLAWAINRRKPSVYNVIATLLCLLGIAFVAVIGKNENAGSNETLGDVLSISCGLFYAFQLVFIDKYVSTEDPICLLVFELATVGALFWIITATAEFPFYASEFSLSAEAVWKILYLAVLATCFAQFGQIVGQKYTNPTAASLILSLESVFGVLFDILLGGTTLSAFIIIGFAIIFVAELTNELAPKISRDLKNKKSKVRNS